MGIEFRNILTICFLLAGFFFVAVSVIGVLRMHDFYSRLHAAGVGETLGLILCCIGLFIYEGVSITGLKILLIFLAVFVASPIGTHIIGKVAYQQSMIVRQEAEAKNDAEARNKSVKEAQ